MTTDHNKPQRLAFVGDVFLGLSHVQMDPAILQRFRLCYHVIANLESPICEPSPLESSKILLRSAPGSEWVLRNWGITAVTLANNHVFDHGNDGFKATCKALSGAGISFAGAGMNRNQAAEPLILNCGSARIGIISCTEAGTDAKLAADDESGCYALNLPVISDQIMELKRTVDFVVVSPHWGYCDYKFPTLEAVNNGEALLAAGANLVLGHHSHVVQGFHQRPDGQAVCYSLGNFAFSDYNTGNKHRSIGHQEYNHGLIVFVDFQCNQQPRIEFVHTAFSCDTVSLDPEQERRQAQFEMRSNPFSSVIDYPTFWRNVVRRRIYARLIYWLNPRTWLGVNLSTLKALGIMLKHQYHR